MQEGISYADEHGLFFKSPKLIKYMISTKHAQNVNELFYEIIMLHQCIYLNVHNSLLFARNQGEVIIERIVQWFILDPPF